MNPICVSSWALHRAIGQTFWDTPDNPIKRAAPTYGEPSVGLLDVPARLAAMGIRHMELCHFHLTTADRLFLDDLRHALDEADVTLWSLLIDAGDITHPIHHARDAAWIGGWVDVAGQIGAINARVIAGKQEPGDDADRHARFHLRELAARATNDAGVRLMTENWFAFLPTPAHVLSLLDDLDSHLGLCLDWGNWDGNSDKYDDLAAIASRAESCHAKIRFAAPGTIEEEDTARCLALMRDAGYGGPFTLVDGGPGPSEWDGIAQEKARIEA